MTDLIFDSAKRLFALHPIAPASGGGLWNADLWQAIEEAGYPLALLSEDEGGFSLVSAEAFGLLAIAAGRAAPVPLGETMLANWLLAKAGLPLAQGPAGIAPEGKLRRIPWGRHLGTLAVYEPNANGVRVRRVDLAAWTDALWQEADNLAGEPRDTPVGDFPSVEEGLAAVSVSALEALGPLLRVQQMAGALQAVLDMAVQYAGERVQFGKPLGKFQAIQQYLAVMAGETAAAHAGATMAADAFPLALSAPEEFRLIVAAAKIRAGDAAGAVSGLAHQVHGAIGFSCEYALHPLTRRLWAWRDEHGREADWAEDLGRVATGQKTGVWPFITKLQAGFF